eukprot:scaffold234205_cov36-Prasinocladus_malaysianus.AAC.1
MAMASSSSERPAFRWSMMQALGISKTQPGGYRKGHIWDSGPQPSGRVTQAMGQQVQTKCLNAWSLAALPLKLLVLALLHCDIDGALGVLVLWRAKHEFLRSGRAECLADLLEPLQRQAGHALFFPQVMEEGHQARARAFAS